ncbi:LON peptidase substrate-binding domain-containing protein [Aliiroseovarius crassostreae]|uniref:LON peptidase substrate-binding domain-containing protein n=1 Tax=Aliiroseovarius crassostreae TaxID=154981 RepID=A0A9Q9HD89_9RHOB|nr:LON peptidase substrate-binding domain-containing protein [Aliiroseovarius crassostreae]UWP88816.1 LON peptidase substrate-binding domain-containing protein [Aliiroseovarius crassostreae]UWP95122.1 LON peptidase substrate-binding domain-containing protein [Aliiroseovarius crassostreae]UWQ07720.1 LON peptidase substrate-binding domain-containing protein [Aliiroseovarius crassostreae]
MITAADLPDTVPIFPLAGALLLPRGRLPLHIFEPRYLAMFEDALKTRARLIGMVQPQGEALHGIGCAGRITSFTETEDGRYMVTLTGVSRFRLIGVQDGFTPYKYARVNWTCFDRDLGKPERDPQMKRPAFLDLLARYFALEELQSDWESLKEAEDELLINALATLCPFGPEDKQALLEAPSLTTRRETLEALMEIALRSREGDETLQ